MFLKNRFRYQEGDGGDGAGSGTGDGPTLESLGKQIEEMKTSNEALTSSNATLTSDNERLNAKVGEANKHTAAAESAAKKALQDKNKADGNFEELFKSSEADRDKLHDELKSRDARDAKKEEKAAAMNIAIKLADGENVSILADYVAKRLKFTDQGIKVTDSAGNLTVSTLEDLQTEFSGSARFGSLLKGRQSSGGGASGGAGNGSAGAKTITRAEFDALDPTARAKSMKEGTKVVEN